MIKNIEFSINHQLEKIQSRYKKEIKQIEALRDDKEEFYRYLAKLYLDRINLKATNSLFPFYYILTRDYQMGWILLNYLNLRFGMEIIYNPKNKNYHQQAKQELENPSVWDMKPLWYHDEEDIIMSLGGGATCFRLLDDYIPRALDIIRKGNSAEPRNDYPPYNISPEARYNQVEHVKEYHLSWDSYYILTRLLEIYFRQEKLAETEECLFRLRHIISKGEPPSRLITQPRVRNGAAFLNMYDAWFEGRHESDPARRKSLGWMALYWYMEHAYRLLDDSNIDAFVHFSDGCEIIGEFELMGDDQDQFLHHLKRFVVHASISFTKKMMANPIQVIPFAERNMPGYEEFQKIFRENIKK